MKRIQYKSSRIPSIFAALALMFSACNKDLPEAEPIITPAPSGQSIVSLVNAAPDLTIFKAAIARAGANLTATLADSTGVFTVFAPTDAAFQAAGIQSAASLAAFTPGRIDTLLRYHIIGGQRLTSSIISTAFPNAQEPSLFVLAAPSASLPPGLRMSLFPSKRNSTVWINNIPLSGADVVASNGIIHKVPQLVAPPSQFLWDRINTDTELSYLKAAIIRADSGTAAASTLQAALQNPAASLTLFAPTDAAFRQMLTLQITQALMAQGMDQTSAGTTAATLASSPNVFSNPVLYPVLTAQVVKAVVVYHLLGKRAFSVNLPPAATSLPTLLNSAIQAHPGVSVQATFAGPMVTAATVKGLGNPAASNVLINPLPAPLGTSDQFYINGVLHKIDQVLIPQ